MGAARPPPSLLPPPPIFFFPSFFLAFCSVRAPLLWGNASIPLYLPGCHTFPPCVCLCAPESALTTSGKHSSGSDFRTSVRVVPHRAAKIRWHRYDVAVALRRYVGRRLPARFEPSQNRVFLIIIFFLFGKNSCLSLDGPFVTGDSRWVGDSPSYEVSYARIANPIPEKFGI